MHAEWRADHQRRLVETLGAPPRTIREVGVPWRGGTSPIGAVFAFLFLSAFGAGTFYWVTWGIPENALEFQLCLHGRRTAAEVRPIREIRRYRNSRPVWEVEYRFRDSAGKTHQAKTDISADNKQRLDGGATLEAAYLPDNPAVSGLDVTHMPFNVLHLIGAIFLAGGVWVGVKAPASYRRNCRLLTCGVACAGRLESFGVTHNKGVINASLEATYHGTGGESHRIGWFGLESNARSIPRDPGAPLAILHDPEDPSVAIVYSAEYPGLEPPHGKHHPPAHR